MSLVYVERLIDRLAPAFLLSLGLALGAASLVLLAG